jgi:AraC-like DNA-binding protein
MPKILDTLEFNSFIDQASAAPAAGRELAALQESHREREILFTLQGETDFVLNGKKFSSVPGQAFFIDGWVPHQMSYAKLKNDIVHIWIHLHARKLFAMSYERHCGEVLHSSGMWSFPAGMLELIDQRWQRAKEEDDPEIRKNWYSSIVNLLVDELRFQGASNKPSQNKDDEISVWIKNYISMNYGRDSSMAELERLTGYHRRHIMRKFKKETGMTIGEYINCVRRGFVADAGKRITQKEIAFQLGFKSPAAYWLWHQRNVKKPGDKI